MSSTAMELEAKTASTPLRSQSALPAKIQVLRFESFDDVISLREPWNALVERVGGDIFNTFDWCATWWKHFGHGRKLVLFIARREGEVVSAWPLFRETIWWGPVFLRVVRVVGCDHGVMTSNLLAHADVLDTVASKVMETLEKDHAWDLFHVGEIPGYAENDQALTDALRKTSHVGGVHLDAHAYPHAIFEVPNSYEDFLTGLSLKERRNVRHDERGLDKQGGKYVEAGQEDIDAAFDRLIELHQAHWAARGRQGLFQDVPGIEAFHRELARKCAAEGMLALVEVQSKEGVLASEYALRFNRRLHWIIGGRKEEVSSRLGFCALMHLAVRDRLTMIDGLPGTYDYKRRLGARTLAIKTISVFPRMNRGRIRLAFTRWLVQLASLIYHRVWYWHAAPWLAKRAPHLSKLIIPSGIWTRFTRSKFLVVGSPGTPDHKPTPESVDQSAK